MAELMYYILMAAFAVIPILLAVFFLIARFSGEWEVFTLDTPVFRRTEAVGGAIFLLILAAALWTTLKA